MRWRKEHLTSLLVQAKALGSVETILASEDDARKLRFALYRHQAYSPNYTVQVKEEVLTVRYSEGILYAILPPNPQETN